MGHQGIDGRPDGALGLLQLADIPLVERQARLLGELDLAPAVLPRADPFGKHRRSLGNPPAWLDQPCLAELVHQLEQPRAGHPHRRLTGDGGQRQPLAVDLGRGDGAIHGARATGNEHTFESRPGGGGGDQDALPIRDQHLPVGAQVDRHHRPLGLIVAKIGQAGQRVRADKAADQGRQRDARPGWEDPAEQMGGIRQRLPPQRLERLGRQGVDRQVRQQVMHGHIAHHRDVLDALQQALGQLERVDRLVDRGQRQALQAGGVLGAVLGRPQARDDICAIHRLLV